MGYVVEVFDAWGERHRLDCKTAPEFILYSDVDYFCVDTTDSGDYCVFFKDNTTMVHVCENGE
jgi:hypothetical protein